MYGAVFTMFQFNYHTSLWNNQKGGFHFMAHVTLRILFLLDAEIILAQISL